MELKKHYKMYKSGKQLVVAAVAAVAAGVMFAGNQSASADTWQAKSVDEVAEELQQTGDVHNYTFQEGDTVWALATALHMSVEDFSAQYSIANPELIIAGQAVNGQIVVVPVSSDATVDSDADAAASQAADESAAAASQAAADSAYAASVAAASQAAADSAYAASVAAAQEAQAESAAAASVAAAQAAQAQTTTSANESQTTATDANQNVTTGNVDTSSDSTPVATGDFAEAINTMNQIRHNAGILTDVVYDPSLTATAQMRAHQQANVAYGDDAHWASGSEVLAHGFGSGARAMYAWYNETGMVGGNAHRNWILNVGITRVGFGYDPVNDTFVGIAG
ncbi:KxYKxGKxW signal peptide domain-containing protein [Weissella confusa]|uniref:KxYKxGKxW signal peptide domain-containing protein n=1 Tax=Weissella confusa TaxID=1583 RepID=UPI0022E06F7E|nr:KxYKxGKxW signal peptide domain-containing protein [Weissella confusa]